MENMKKNKLLIIPIILVVLIIILGITYAWLTTVLNGTKINRIKAGTLDLVLDDNTSNGINLEYAIPQSNSQGLNNQAYTFKVINNGSINAKYTIYLEDEELEDGEVRMSDSNIKFDLVKNNEESNPRLLSTVISNNRRELDSNVVINGGSTNTYSLRLWIDSEATKEEVANKVFKGKIKLEAVQTEESEELANIPTIDTCPNCVYGFSTDAVTIGTSQLPENVTKDYTTLNMGYFLGYAPNETTGVVERAFACGIENYGTDEEKPFCLEGKDITKFQSNIALINRVFPECDTLSHQNAVCSGNPIYAVATNTGVVSVFANGSSYASMAVGVNSNVCSVSADGVAQCYE